MSSLNSELVGVVITKEQEEMPKWLIDETVFFEKETINNSAGLVEALGLLAASKWFSENLYWVG